MNKSESIKNLAIALSKAQGELNNPTNSKEAVVQTTKVKYSYFYATLDEILNIVRPILSKHGLSILQVPSTDADHVLITTILLHDSGEFIEAEPLKLKMQQYTPQGAGSAITYARRYAVASILGISSQDDDDGGQAEKESKGNINSDTTKKTSGVTATPVEKTISEKQVKRLYAIASSKLIDSKVVDDHLQRKFNKKAGDLTTREYNIVCNGYETMEIEPKIPDTEEELTKGIPDGFVGTGKDVPF